MLVSWPSARTIKPSIKAKTPAIVPHQGISRQTMKFLNGEVGRVTPCAPSWRTQALSLAGIAQVNPGFLVGRRRRAEDCPPYLAASRPGHPHPRPFAVKVPFRVFGVFRGFPSREPKSETRGPFPQNRSPPRKLCAFLNWASCYSIVCLSVN